MIEESYVSFEVAKLLKEKGFDEGCRLHYHYVEEFNKYFPTEESISGFEQYYYPCPTLQMTVKWLREVHKLYVTVVPCPLNFEHDDIQDGWCCEVTHLSDLSYDGDYEFFQRDTQHAKKLVNQLLSIV